MAKLPALVSALATGDGRDHATIDYFARTLREAGLLPTTKRGVGSAEMTPREAASLLIGVNVSETPRKASVLVPLYRRLVGVNYGPDLSGRDDLLGKLDQAENFGDALEILIEGAPEMLLLQKGFMDDAWANMPQPYRETLADDHCRLVVSFYGPYPYAEIKLETPGMNAPVQLDWRFRINVDDMENVPRGSADSDRRTRVTVGLPTISRLYASLLVKGADA